MTKTREIVILIIVATILGGLWLWQKNNKPVETADTHDWLTYRNEKYGFELKYPPDWQFIESKNTPGFVAIGAFGFTPSTARNQYCDFEKIQAQYRTELCNIEVHVEENSGQTIRDFLEMNYLPYDIHNQRLPGQTLADAINRLKVETKEGIEFAKVNSGFVKYYGGSEGDQLWADLVDEKRQYIINPGQYIVFISDHIHPIVKNKLAPGDLFDQIVNTVKILKKEG